MFRENRVAKNAAWIIACRVVQSLLSLIIGTLTARYLGPSNYGLINYAASLVTFVAPVMYLGLNAVMVQEIINHPEEEGTIIGTSMFMSILSAFICMIGVAAFVSIANPGEKETLIVCSLYSVILVFQAIDLLQYWFQAKLLSKYTSIVMLVAYGLVSIYKIFILANRMGIQWFALSNVLDSLIIAVCLIIIYNKIGNSKLKIVFKRIPYLFSRSKYYIISNLMVMVFAQTDKIMLKVMLDDSATGYYSASVTCVGITSFVFAAIIDSFRPVIFQSKKQSQVLFEKNIVRLYSIIMWLSFLQSIGMTILARIIILVLYGDGYLPSIPLLQVVVWYSAFSYSGAVRDVWMLAEDKQKHLVSINSLGAVSNIFLNWLLIPQFGAMGAAIASLMTQFSTNVILGFIIKPMRRNNYLMIKGLNPKVIVEMISNR